jgi:hypothetical protein
MEHSGYQESRIREEPREFAEPEFVKVVSIRI